LWCLEGAGWCGLLALVGLLGIGLVVAPETLALDLAFG